jgi:hypothetical protein
MEEIMTAEVIETEILEPKIIEPENVVLSVSSIIQSNTNKIYSFDPIWIQRFQSYEISNSDNRSAIVDKITENSGTQASLRDCKLTVSKTPILQTLIYCAINKHGLEIIKYDKFNHCIILKFHNFDQYYEKSRVICYKNVQAVSTVNRVKALKRWFISFPTASEIKIPFIATIKREYFMVVAKLINNFTRNK